MSAPKADLREAPEAVKQYCAECEQVHRRLTDEEIWLLDGFAIGYLDPLLAERDAVIAERDELKFQVDLHDIDKWIADLGTRADRFHKEALVERRRANEAIARADRFSRQVVEVTAERDVLRVDLAKANGRIFRRDAALSAAEACATAAEDRLRKIESESI